MELLFQESGRKANPGLFGINNESHYSYRGYFLALIAILPTIIGRLLGVPQTISYFFGGTALLILVGVVLDTMKQIESHLLMKRYEGFMKKGRVRGRE